MRFLVYLYYTQPFYIWSKSCVLYSNLYGIHISVTFRYGSNSMVQFEMNLQRLCQQLKRLLKPETLVMWTTSMPVSQTIRGGFLVDEISFMSDVLRLDVLSANYYSSQVCCL